MIAVIKTGGKQYIVSKGDNLRVEKLPGKVGDTVKFEEVLLVADDKKTQVGAPVLEGAIVAGKIQEQGRARKITAIKYKAKVRYRRKFGHRQPFTAVAIESISVK